MTPENSQSVKEDNQIDIVQSKFFLNCVMQKSKRFRSAFTIEQTTYLEKQFRRFSYIGSAERKELANKLNIPERAIKIWYQNRRMKAKKEAPNKESEIENSKDMTKFTNDTNNNRCTIETKNGPINVSKKLTAQTTTDSTKLNEQLCSNMTMLKSKKDVESSNSDSTVTKNSQQAPVGCHKVKSEPTLSPVKVSKEKNKCRPTKKQNQAAARYCPTAKSYQDMPQDLSRGVICELYSQQPPVNSIPGSRLMHIPSSYSPPTFTPGDVIWKPVNMLTVLPRLPSSPLSMSVPHNSAGVHLVNHNIKTSCNCSCNCQSPLLTGFSHVDTRVPPQYVIATPFSHAK